MLQVSENAQDTKTCNGMHSQVKDAHTHTHILQVADKPLALPEFLRQSNDSFLALLVHVLADQAHVCTRQTLQRTPCHVPTCDSSCNEKLTTSEDLRSNQKYLFKCGQQKPPCFTISWSNPRSLLQRRCLFAVFPLKAPIQNEPVKTSRGTIYCTINHI